MITTNLPQEFKDILEERVPHLVDIMEMGGVYLAGGALRTLVSTDESFDAQDTDIDLFFDSPEALNRVKEYLEKKTPYFKVFQCPENKLASYVYLNGEEDKWKLQCISVDYYQTVDDLLNSFDFTATMFGTDWKEFKYGDTSVNDVLEKHLVWNRITYPASSLRRMNKYTKKGYWMREEDYQEFVARVWEHDVNITDSVLVYVD